MLLIFYCKSNEKLRQKSDIIEYLDENNECILPKRHLQYTFYGYLCSHLVDTKVNNFFLAKNEKYMYLKN